MSAGAAARTTSAQRAGNVTVGMAAGDRLRGATGLDAEDWWAVLVRLLRHDDA